MIDYTTFPVEDLARLAAFIDGEGCISIKVNANVRWANGKQFCLRFQLGNTDPRLIQWCRETFQVGSSYVQSRFSKSQQKFRRKPLWYWEVTGKNLCALLKACYPYLIIKKEQAEIAFAFQKLIGKGFGGPNNPLNKANFDQRLELKNRLHLLKKEIA